MFEYNYQDEYEKQRQRLKNLMKEQELSKYEPTWEEIWITGYQTNNGKHKPGILNTKSSAKDLERLQEVKKEIELGNLGSGIENLRKFTKAHAMRLYQELQESKKEDYIQKLIDECPSNYELITTRDHLFEFEEDMKREELLVIDTETTGLLMWNEDRVVGICVGLEKSNRFAYIPFGHNVSDQQLSEEVVLSTFRPYLEDHNIKKVLHNFKYDCHMLFNAHNVELNGIYWDTMSAQNFLFEEEESYALKNLVTKYKDEIGLKDDSKTYEELFGRGGFQNTELNIAKFYGSHDVFLTLRLFRWQESFFKKMPVLYKLLMELEMPQLQISLEMERNGMKIDLPYARQYTLKLMKDVQNLEKELHELFGDINWNSPLQIQKLLYDEMKLEDVSNKRSTDAKTLKKLVKQQPLLQKVLDYREKNKLLSTYFEPLPKMLGKDGRLHGQFHPHSTVTSRYSSNRPNLQNIPKEARPMFVPDKGKIIVGMDFRQIEPRVLSFKSGDKNLQKPFVEGWDYYSSIASRVFKKPIEECGNGSIYRNRSKTINLASTYGVSDISLSETMQLPIEDVRQIISDFYESNPDMAKFKQNIFKEIDEKGYTTTHRGRKRRFPNHPQLVKQLRSLKEQYEKRLGRAIGDNIWEEKGLNYRQKRSYWDIQKVVERNYRMGFNFVIQGSAAEIMKQSLLDLYKYCKDKEDHKLIATIHDEVLLEVPDTITREQLKELEHIMVSGSDISPIPLEVDQELYLQWGNSFTVEEWFDEKKRA